MRRGNRIETRALALMLLALPCPGTVLGQAAGLDSERIRDLVTEETPAALDLFRSYLGFPNDGRFPEDIDRLVAWLEGAFRERGFETERLTTPENPHLYAERRVAEPAATVLVYLQADGQPVDPPRWEQSDPYAPVLKQPGPDGRWQEIPWGRLSGDLDDDWRIFARSASDSKGPNVQFLKAVDVLEIAGSALDFDLKVIVDTQEEMGSPHLPDLIRRHRDKLAADMLVIFDGPPHYSGRPSLKFGARGLALFTLTTYGPRVPQHSGHYGNYAPNPGDALARILASMKDASGRVTLPGFYDGIELDEETLRVLAAVPDDEREIHSSLGISDPDDVAESLQGAVQYPSLNIRGLRSGWVGPESRTIVPATATAEVDVRLVRETDGHRLLGLIRAHIEGLGYHVVSGRDPTGEERAAHARIARFDGSVSYAAFRTDLDSTPGVWLRAGMRDLYGDEPVLIRTSGGSIPIAPFVTTLGIPAVTVPTVNPDNNQHSPNENIRVGTFLEGIAIMASVLSQPVRPFVTSR